MQTKSIVSSVDIQNAYQKLYVYLMDYLWDYKVVEALANLEITCYKTFPDKDEMLKYLNELRKGIQATYNELSKDDEPDFEKAYTRLSNAIDNYDPESALVEIYSVTEPIEIDTEITDDTKDVFKVGDIVKREVDESEDVSTEDEETPEESNENKITNPFEEE
jgi:hypothetical protein